jgi:hypothetical protein
MSLPWEKNFTPAAVDPNLVEDLTKAAEQAVTGVVSQAEQVVPLPPVVTSIITDAEQVAGKVVGAAVAPTTVTPPVPATSTSITPTGGSIATSIEAAALQAAKSATASVLPSIADSLEKSIASKAQAEITAVLTKIEGGTEPAAPSLDDFTKADSRSRAVRTLLTGLVLSALWGLVNIIGNVATVDWHNANAFPQVAAMAATAVIGSVLAYIERVVKEPAHIANATIIPSS